VLPFAVSERWICLISYTGSTQNVGRRLGGSSLSKTIQCEKDQIASARVDPDDGWEDFKVVLLGNIEGEWELVEEEENGSASSNDDN
jgi:hypothetical protein